MRQKHIPQRSCVGCGLTQPKRQMVRVVRTVTGEVVADPTGKRAGRGAYLCKKAECWEKALQRSALNRALKVEVSTEDRDELIRFGRQFGPEYVTQSAPEAEGEAGS
ncbi:MAG: RNase P modulator RnpM [Chloroflexota bacterium]